MKVGLYSISYAGLWYAGEPLTVEELVDRAKQFGFEGVEIDGKRPHGFALDYDEKRRKEVRKYAEAKGIEIVGVAGNNNFVSPFQEQRENELLALAEQIRLCRDLGAKVVRVFLAWRGIALVDGKGTYDIGIKYDIDHLSPDATRWQRWNWAKECLREGARIAEKYGVTLALQNHPPLVQSYRDIIDMVREVGSEYLKCSLDAPLLTSQDPEFVRKAVLDVGALQVISHYGGEFGRDKNGQAIQIPTRGDEDRQFPNYHVFVKTLKDIGYTGYINYELCHPVLNERHELAGLETVDGYVQCACEFMKNIVKTA